MKNGQTRLDPNLAIDKLLKSLDTNTQMIALALNSIDNFTFVQQPKLPKTILNFNYTTKKESSELKDEYKTWLLKLGLKEIMRIVHDCFVEGNIFINIYKKNNKLYASKEEINNEIFTIIINNRKKYFPTILEEINKEFKEPLIFTDILLSINKVRNCLEHRNGVVSHLDTNKDNTLVLDYRHFEIYGEKIGVEGGTQIKLSITDRSKVFNINEKIDLDIVEFNDLIFTVVGFGQEFSEKLNTIKY